MRIGVPRERKVMEFRVGMVPDGVRQLCAGGHEVRVERGAGEGSGFSDEDYAGARLVDTDEVWERSELIVKVKEPQPDEIPRLRAGQTLFTYLHLAASPGVAEALCDAGIVAIAYAAPLRSALPSMTTPASARQRKPHGETTTEGLLYCRYVAAPPGC